MKAAVLHEVGGPLTVEDVELDGPRAGEIRIRVQASGLCHSDYHLMKGDNPTIVPAVLGHEAAGIVEAVGEDVSGIKVGDLVATSFSSFCGECPECQTGHSHRCDSKPSGVPRAAGSRITWHGKPVYQLAGIGGFAEEVVAHQRSVVKIPKGNSRKIGNSMTGDVKGHWRKECTGWREAWVKVGRFDASAPQAS